MRSTGLGVGQSCLGPQAHHITSHRKCPSNNFESPILTRASAGWRRHGGRRKQLYFIACSLLIGFYCLSSCSTDLQTFSLILPQALTDTLKRYTFQSLHLFTRFRLLLLLCFYKPGKTPNTIKHHGGSNPGHGLLVTHARASKSTSPQPKRATGQSGSRATGQTGPTGQPGRPGSRARPRSGPYPS